MSVACSHFIFKGPRFARVSKPKAAHSLWAPLKIIQMSSYIVQTKMRYPIFENEVYFLLIDID